MMTKRKNGLYQKGIYRQNCRSCSFTIVPRYVLGGNGYTAPSDKLNVACMELAVWVIMTQSALILKISMLFVMSMIKGPQKLTINFLRLNVKKDFRVLLNQEKEIDAVTISSPDHTHAVAAMMAMKWVNMPMCRNR
ncbi:MAG: hypothetical protein CM1200mP10_03800 [Candidatus Neomarinimicrobiota bacterium]|nr:MAG: hypothetical protein CM1200mP10_03800 [Candidatus Neomarinimicrobiota bacterium]